MPDDVKAAPPALATPRREAPKTVGELMRREEETIHRLSAVCTRYLPPERAAHLAISAIRKVPLLAQCTPASFMGSLMASSALGLEPNTLREHAYLIPYKNSAPLRDQRGNILKGDDGRWLMDTTYECQLQIGYRGYLTLFYRSRIIKNVFAEAVYDVDTFEHEEGTRTFLRFSKSLDETRQRDPEGFGFSPGLKGAFCFTELVGDAQAFSVLPLEVLYDARRRSQAWSTARRALDKAQQEEKPKDIERARRNYLETPWVAFEEAMVAKTAIRRHAKRTDGGEDEAYAQIGLAADLDALGDAGMIDMEALADPEVAREVVRGGVDEVRKEQPEEDGGTQADEQPTTGNEAAPQQSAEADKGTGERAPPANSSRPPAASEPAHKGRKPQKGGLF